MTRKCEVVIWYNVEPAQADLPNRIIARAGKEPFDHCTAEGFEEMHFAFETGESAIKCAEGFFEFAAMDSVIKLVAKDYGAEGFRKVYKEPQSAPAGNGEA